MKVSIIIPVYNVYEWLDECLTSIVNQSFEDFELILVDDGSTDGSDKKCEEWAEKDGRIKVLKQSNSGPAVARNRGMEISNGEYLSFIDSDDWLDKFFLEEMYNTAVEADADIVECDIWHYDNRTGKKTRHVCYGSMGREYSREERMVYGHAAMCKCLIRKELFVSNDICFPNCHSEARAIYALLIALANKVVSIKKPLYYYRKFRENSLSQKPRNVDVGAIGVQAFIELINGFKRCGIYKEYEELLERILKYRLSDLLAAMFHRRTEEEFKIMVTDYKKLIAETFCESKDEVYVTFGGYNLNRITWQMNMLHIPSLRFNFSGLISIMHPVSDEIKIACKNKYREIMVNRDVRADFWEILAKERPTYVILDFVEERFDVQELKDGYITLSDAYEECEGISVGRIIEKDSEEGKTLWEESCLTFIEKMQEYVPLNHMILVKNYLSEKVGDINCQIEFEELQKIRETNALLKEFYDFFTKNCGEAHVIEADECDYYFTDEEYQYGAIPSHLNEVVNKEIAQKIEDIILNK